MSKYKYEGYGIIRDTEIDFPYHTDDIVELLDDKDKTIADLEAKLAECEKELLQKEKKIEDLMLCEFVATSLDFNKLSADNCRLREQLADIEANKEKEINRICKTHIEANAQLKQQLAEKENEKSPIPKFKTVGALAAAYLQLEKEFSKKAQLLKQKSLKYDTLEVTNIEFYERTILVNWECNLGFGQCDFCYDRLTNEWTVNAECMSEEFVNALIRKMFEKIKVI